MKKKKKMYLGWKRFLSLALSAAMLLGMVPAEAFAAESSAVYTIWINDKNTTAAENACVTYGDSLEGKLKDADGTVIESPTIVWLPYTEKAPSGDDNWNNWSDGKPQDPGSYYLGYYFSDSQGVSQHSYDGSFVLTINKAQAAAPTDPAWTGGTASWTAVTLNTTGGTLADGAVTGYSVTLKKDGVTVGDPVATTDTKYDFSTVIEEKGSGVYTFAVKATVADTDRYTESAESVSGNKTAALVTVKSGTGIASVTPTDPATLISGFTDMESIKLSATVSDGRTFSGWTVSPEGAVAFTDASATSTTATIAAAYAGDAAVTIKANTSDNAAPTISEYAAGAGSDYGKLTGTAADAGSGVAKYAFSTAASAAEVPASEWQTPESGTAASVTVSQKVTAAGVYSLYVQDASGNTTKSDHTIQATEVDYSGFYVNGTLDTSRKDFLVGTAALTLAEPVRSGYSFDGWFASADGSGNAVTEITAHSSTAVTVYAKWTRSQISIATQPTGYSGEYDGQSHPLSVALDSSVAGDAAYQWYRDGKAIDGATASTYSVKNVTDSGTYTVVVTVTLDGVAKTATSNTVTVAISKKALSLTAVSQTVTYGAAAPAYSYTADGFVTGEDESVLTGGTIACAYDPASTTNSAAGDYPITISGYTNENYEISFVNGKLTVSQKGESSGVTASLAKSEWAYTGEAVVPVVTVTDGAKTLTEGKDYTLAYSNNVDVGSGKVTVTLQGNYSGKIEKTFTISSASFAAAVTLEGWTYGDTANTPSISTNPSGGDVKFYYYSTDRSAATTTQPTAAGSYHVYAVIAATANYTAVTTADTDFTIQKRVIKLTAASGRWSYDGNPHSDATYSQSGTFAGKDGFLSVIVSGSVTNVGTQKNAITYKLTSVTESHKDDYDIQTVDGVLEVYDRDLTYPTGTAWDTSNPGTAAWVAVTRDGLTVSYSVELYRVVDSKYTLLTTVVSDTNTVSFADTIRKDSTDNGVAGYSFKVKAVPSGGVNQGNYSESTYATYASNIYTASVSVSGGTGIDSVTIGGTNKVYLIQGESAALAATKQSGYTFSDPVWNETSGNVSFADAKSASTTLKLNALTAAQTISVAASCGDDLPVITGFSAAANDTNTAVTFTFSATDTKGIVAWAVTTSNTVPADDAWTTVNSTTALNNKTLPDVIAAGTYYFWVKDDGGNAVCSASNSSGTKSIDIYQIDFSAGTDGSGTMASRLKVENTAFKLPQNAFTKAGCSFQNWKGTSGIYADGGSYAANANDTLTAQWTSQQYSYTVNCYLMGIDGTYGKTASSTASYSGTYGTVIAPPAPEQAGFALDTEKSKAITLTQSGLVMNVYYQRLQYSITYSYTMPGDTSETTHTDTYYYGAAVKELAKPAPDGYSFVGWVYSGSGTVPATMPANDLTATGSFSANDTTYVINCYEQDVTDLTSYALVASLGSTVAAKQGDSVTKKASDAVAAVGFTAAYVTVSSGAPGGSTLPAGAGTSVTGTVSAQANTQLNINYYYTRNTYELTLNVYNSNLRKETVYTHTENKLYGAAIDAESFANYQSATWVAPAGTVLAAYADWSTGTAPATMPAGDVSVARDYIKSVEAPYKVEVYYETATAGSYEKQATLNYYASAGTTVTIGADDTSTINYTEFDGSISDFKFYTYSTGNKNNVTSATVLADGTTTLKVYFERKTVTTTITYYYNDGETIPEGYTSPQNVAFATVTKTGKWGTDYRLTATAHILSLASSPAPTIWSRAITASCRRSRQSFRMPT